MRALVTGGLGFIGSTLVDYLIDNDVEVFVIDDLSRGKDSHRNPLAKYMSISVSALSPGKVLCGMFDNDLDWIFHLAARTSVQESIEEPKLYNENNVLGLLNILCLARDIGAERFVFSSSTAVYGDVAYTPIDERHGTDPISPYGVSKLIGEIYCRNFFKTYGVRSTCLRYFNVYGDRQHSEGSYAPVIGKFMDQKNNGLPMTINGDGEQRRDFVHVNDVIAANILAATSSVEAASRATCINIGSGVNYSVNQIANMIGGDRINNIEPLLEPRETLADISYAKGMLGWVPEVSLEDWIA
jgi:nucleoside-diphosphate-sugar epimerase